MSDVGSPGVGTPAPSEAAVLHDIAQRVGNFFGGRAHTYASENADRYRVQDETVVAIAEMIRRVADSAPPRGPRGDLIK